MAGTSWWSRLRRVPAPVVDAVTERTYRRLREGYRLERRGPVQVKGKGELVTWFLVARDAQPR